MKFVRVRRSGVTGRQSTRHAAAALARRAPLLGLRCRRTRVYAPASEQRAGRVRAVGVEARAGPLVGPRERFDARPQGGVAGAGPVEELTLA